MVARRRPLKRAPAGADPHGAGSGAGAGAGAGTEESGGSPRHTCLAALEVPGAFLTSVRWLRGHVPGGVAYPGEVACALDVCGSRVVFVAYVQADARSGRGACLVPLGEWQLKGRSVDDDRRRAVAMAVHPSTGTVYVAVSNGRLHVVGMPLPAEDDRGVARTLRKMWVPRRGDPGAKAVALALDEAFTDRTSGRLGVPVFMDAIDRDVLVFGQAHALTFVDLAGGAECVSVPAGGRVPVLGVTGVHVVTGGVLISHDRGMVLRQAAGGQFAVTSGPYMGLEREDSPCIRFPKVEGPVLHASRDYVRMAEGVVPIDP